MTDAISKPHTPQTPSPRQAADLVDGRNPFGPTHKGIRWALCQLLLQLGRVQATNRIECSKLFDDLDGVLYLVERHIDHEERHVHPLLSTQFPIDAATLKAQHKNLAVLATELRQRAFALEMGEAISDGALDDLYLAFSRFVAEKLQHMHIEETSLSPKLVAAYSPEVLQALAMAVQREMGPDEQSLFTRTAAPASRPG